jgi:hypothetical protein
MCNEYAIKCHICGTDNCMECGDNCSLCNDSVCSQCTFNTHMCKCCKRDVGDTNALPLCTKCIMNDWFSCNKADGFWCDECLTLCKPDSDKCNVCYILENQHDCPLCLEQFDEKPFMLQQCGVHKICKACNYNTLRGCPVCKVGWIS